MTFFPGGWIWSSSSEGYQGGGFWDPKFDQFCSKFKNKPNLGQNYTKLA